MGKYRFKTEEEFKADGLWNKRCNCPNGWNNAGRMNIYLGQDVPHYLTDKCDAKKDFGYGEWFFNASDYVLKETETNNPEYVECVEELADYYGEKGKIYKVSNWNLSKTDCMLEGTTSGSTSKSRFKPSTKEAYDAQNAPVVDKWAIKCTEENKEHLNKFFHSKGSEYKGYRSSWNVSTRHYYHYPQEEEGLWGHITIQKGYREITIEEFYKIAGVEKTTVTYDEYCNSDVEPVKEDKPIPDGYTVKKETLIEDVHSVSVMLSTKNKSKQFKF